MAVNKKIRLGKSENRSFRNRLEAYNLFDHAEYNAVEYALTFKNGVVNGTTAGRQDTAAQPARILATNVRFGF